MKNLNVFLFLFRDVSVKGEGEYMKCRVYLNFGDLSRVFILLRPDWWYDRNFKAACVNFEFEVGSNVIFVEVIFVSEIKVEIAV